MFWHEISSTEHWKHPLIQKMTNLGKFLRNVASDAPTDLLTFEGALRRLADPQAKKVISG
jgi:hypothetical protein